jgi:type IV pilus assembly protein PilW
MIARPKFKVRRQSSVMGGFTLVELMVALTIGLFLVGGLISLLVSTSVARTELDKSGRQIENGRYALQLLIADIRHAGFLSTYMPTGATVIAPDPCLTAVASLGYSTTPNLQVPVAIYGYDGAVADPSCVTNRVAGTDILVVRRVSTTSTPAAAPVAGEVYFQVSNCYDPVTPPPVFVVGTGGFVLQQKDCATAVPLNKVMVSIYYVSSCNVCAPSDNIPTLKVAEYVGGAMVVTPLVEGIQNMQAEYGIDMNGDGTPNCYISNPEAPPVNVGETAPAVCPQPAIPYEWDPAVRAAAVPPLPSHWDNVMSIRLHILARNTEASGGWTDTRTYNLGLAGPSGPFNDGFKRHIYSSVARAVNPSGRRELP